MAALLHLWGMDMKLDHLVVGAMRLGQGLEWMKDRTGLDIPPGGEHLMMGTHNHLTRLAAEGQSDAAYFEVIAPNPELERPSRARWFSFDDPEHVLALNLSPRPVAWVVAVQDLAGLLESLPRDLSSRLGRPVDMQRGDLHWKFCLRDDGQIPDKGLLPILIEWPGGVGPADNIADMGLQLQTLHLSHPSPGQLVDDLKAIGCLDPLSGLLNIQDGAHQLDFDLSVRDNA